MPVIEPVKKGPLVDSLPIPHHGQGAEVPVRHLGCRVTCDFAGATVRHHGRLIAVEYDQDAVLELMELAVTWPELAYSKTETIPPNSWMTFAEAHRWADPDRVERIFSIATDIVRTARRSSHYLLGSSSCHFQAR